MRGAHRSPGAPHVAPDRCGYSLREFLTPFSGRTRGSRKTPQRRARYSQGALLVVDCTRSDLRDFNPAVVPCSSAHVFITVVTTLIQSGSCPGPREWSG